MATYKPRITTFNNGLVTVSSTDGISYETIINSMGSVVYGVELVYMKSNSNEQILNGFTIEEYDVKGYIKSFNQKPTIDPYQYQKSVFFKLTKENVILNGQTTFNIDILPNEVLYLVLIVKELSVKDYLSGVSLSDNDFFKNFSNVI